MALAPVTTDGPLLVLGAVLAGAAAQLSWLLAAINLLGAGFVAWLGVGVEIGEVAPDSVWKAAGTNVLKPRAWLRGRA